MRSGRYQKADVELRQKIARLRAAGLQWTVISQRVGIPVSTCKCLKVR